MSTRDRKGEELSSSKKEQVRCRVARCQEMVATQNYGRHLSRFHPQEDSKDRRPFGFQKFSFGGPKENEVKKQEEELQDERENLNAEETFDKEDANANIVDDDMQEEDLQSRKRIRIENDVLEDSVKEDLADIEKTVDKIVHEMKLNPLKTSKIPLKRIKDKVQFILANIKVENTVEDLEKILNEVRDIKVAGKVVDTEENKKVKSATGEDVKALLKSCRSVAEVEAKVPEYEYNEDEDLVNCRVCSQTFKYDITTETGQKYFFQPRSPERKP